MGLPVIATNFSGPSFYLTQENSFPLRVEAMEQVPNGAEFGMVAAKWARPSVAHLRELMRFVFENRDDARLRGIQAREDILSKFHHGIIADQVISRLKKISQDKT